MTSGPWGQIRTALALRIPSPSISPRSLRTAAIVVDWHKPVETAAALQSLRGMTIPLDTLICIENESTDQETPRTGGGVAQGTIVIPIAENIGFAAAVNLGVARALRDGAEWILL